MNSSPSPLPLLSLSVEPPKGSLTVEHLKVMAALTVEPAYASSPSPLLISRAPSPLPWGRVPLLISRACLRTLKVMAALTVEPAYASLLVECANAP